MSGGRTLALPALIVALAAVAAAAGAWFDVAALARVGGGALVLAGGVAFGLLVRATPVEPSPIKLFAFASALGLPLLGALHMALTAGLTARSAVALECAFAALLALSVARRPARFAPPGRAAWIALIVAALVAAGAGWFVASEPGLTWRASSPAAVTHATFADAWGEGPRPALDAVQPWLLGGAPWVRPSAAALVAAVSALASVGPLLAVGLVDAWCLTLLVLGAYLAAGAVAHGGPERAAGLRDLGATAASAALVVVALGERGLADPSAMVGLVLAGAGLLAALHAARSGAAPWPLLAVVAIAAAAAFAPALGVAAAAVAGALALQRRRPLLAAFSAAAFLPGAWLARASGQVGVDVVGRSLGAADVRALAALAALVLVPVVLARTQRALPRGPFAAAALALCVLGPVAVALGARPVVERLRGSNPIVVEVDGHLAVRPSSEPLRDIAGAFDALRVEAPLGEPGTAAFLRWSGGDEPEPSAPPSLTPLLTGVPMWWDRRPAPGAPEDETTSRGDARSVRGEVVRALLAERETWSPRFDRVLGAARDRGLVLFVLVTEADRRRTTLRGAGRRGPDLVLARLGAEVVHERGSATLYVLR